MPLKHILLSTLILSSIIATTSHAEPFIGAGLGQSKTKDWYVVDDFYSLGAGEAYSDNTSTAIKIFAGATLNKFVAFRAGATDLGEIKAGGRLGSNFHDDKAKAHAIFIDSIFQAPINDRIGVFIKLGAAKTTVEYSFAQSFGGFPKQGKTKASEFTLVPGLGINLKATDKVSLSLEMERYRKTGDDTTGESDIDVISAGLTYHL